MNEIRFEWDETKNEINQKKHGISFEDAATVFYDEEALVIADEEHSAEEDRHTNHLSQKGREKRSKTIF